MAAGNPIRELRESLDVTQAELSKETGINRPILSAVETGVIGIDTATLDNLKKALLRVASGKVEAKQIVLAENGSEVANCR